MGGSGDFSSWLTGITFWPSSSVLSEYGGTPKKSPPGIGGNASELALAIGPQSILFDVVMDLTIVRIDAPDRKGATKVEVLIQTVYQGCSGALELCRSVSFYWSVTIRWAIFSIMKTDDYGGELPDRCPNQTVLVV